MYFSILLDFGITAYASLEFSMEGSLNIAFTVFDIEKTKVIFVGGIPIVIRYTASLKSQVDLSINFGYCLKSYNKY